MSEEISNGQDLLMPRIARTMPLVPFITNSAHEAPLTDQSPLPCVAFASLLRNFFITRPDVAVIP